jgi:hypothetical protein
MKARAAAAPTPAAVEVAVSEQLENELLSGVPAQDTTTEGAVL